MVSLIKYLIPHIWWLTLLAEHWLSLFAFPEMIRHDDDGDDNDDGDDDDDDEHDDNDKYDDDNDDDYDDDASM